MYTAASAYKPAFYDIITSSMRDILYETVLSRLELTIEQSVLTDESFCFNPVYGAALGIYYQIGNYLLFGQKGQQPNKMPRTGGHAGNSKTGGGSKIKIPVPALPKIKIKWPVPKKPAGKP